MKPLAFLLMLGLTFSCHSQPQEKISPNVTFTATPSAAFSSTFSDSTYTLKLLFTGDIMQHQAQIDAARTVDGYNYASCFSAIAPTLSEADWTIGNLELTFGGKPYRGYPSFSAPDELLPALSSVGFNVMTTANNHCLDSGKRGLQRTIRLLDSLQIKHTGTFIDNESRDEQYPLILDKNNIRIALLNYTYGTNGITATSPNIVNFIDTLIIRQDIARAQAQHPDVIIACMHWGEEYKRTPNAHQKQLVHWLIDKGVDHIIGSHPHVIQPLELRKDSINCQKHVVVYSLGNFISNMSAPHTDVGIVFMLELEKRYGITTVSNAHYKLVWTDRPTLSHKKEHRIYPSTISPDSLTPASRQHMKNSLEKARIMLRSHYRGINEKNSDYS